MRVPNLIMIISIKRASIRETSKPTTNPAKGPRNLVIPIPLFLIGLTINFGLLASYVFSKARPTTSMIESSDNSQSCSDLHSPKAMESSDTLKMSKTNIESSVLQSLLVSSTPKSALISNSTSSTPPTTASSVGASSFTPAQAKLEVARKAGKVKKAKKAMQDVFTPQNLRKIKTLYKAIRWSGCFEMVNVKDSEGNHISIRFI